MSYGPLNGYGHFYVRLDWTGFGLLVDIVEGYILLMVLLHVRAVGSLLVSKGRPTATTTSTCATWTRAPSATPPDLRCSGVPHRPGAEETKIAHLKTLFMAILAAAMMAIIGMFFHRPDRLSLGRLGSLFAARLREQAGCAGPRWLLGAGRITAGGSVELPAPPTVRAEARPRVQAGHHGLQPEDHRQAARLPVSFRWDLLHRDTEYGKIHGIYLEGWVLVSCVLLYFPMPFEPRMCAFQLINFLDWSSSFFPLCY